MTYLLFCYGITTALSSSMNATTTTNQGATDMTPETTNRYQVIDMRTGVIMGTYASRARALRKADQLDLAYGAVRYRVQAC
jgi:hypothetical protein